MVITMVTLIMEKLYYITLILVLSPQNRPLFLSDYYDYHLLLSLTTVS